jgi:hypothetical protein
MRPAKAWARSESKAGRGEGVDMTFLRVPLFLAATGKVLAGDE